MLADEQEDMIDKYIEKCTMYVLDDDGIKCECVITDEGNDILEIKNIATVPEHQGKATEKLSLTLSFGNTKHSTAFYRWVPATVR